MSLPPHLARLQAFSDLTASHAHHGHTIGSALLAFLRILIKRVLVDAHILPPDTLQRVAHSVAGTAQVSARATQEAGDVQEGAGAGAQGFAACIVHEGVLCVGH